MNAPAETLTPAAPQDHPVPTSMSVRKRNGALEPVDVNKIVRAVARCGGGLAHVDVLKVATRTIGGLFDGAATAELDALSIHTAAGLIAEEPEYSRLAARLLSTVIDKEVENQDIHSFSQSVAAGERLGLVAGPVAAFVARNARKLNDALEPARTDLFEYFGLRTVYDRYLLRHPETRQVIETPQQFFLRVACGLAATAAEALELYGMLSRFEYMPSSPTLFNAGTRHPQMSSCYLLDSPADGLEPIYKRYTDIALLSKFSGGIGLSYSRVRSRGSLIRSTNGRSNGIVPWLKTLDSSVSAVNQGGKRKGACCVYLEPWHADVEEFLELRDGTGDPARRTQNLHLAHWIPDLFMRRAEAGGDWSLFDPKDVPELVDSYGAAFEAAYADAERRGLAKKSLPARELYARMMRTLAETGNGWMCFKDACNAKSNQTGQPGAVVHSSNLCTEIIEVTSQGETAVCNLGSINLARHVDGGRFDFARLAANVRAAVPFLDRVVDLNYYPTPEAAASNARWRPVGLGLMGLQDAFFQLGLAFDSPEARALSRRVSEESYFHALSASVELAERLGAHPSFAETRAAQGVFQFELWGVKPADMGRWEELRARMVKHGLRNSLLLAVAPTATIASIVGCCESIEPQVSNLYKRETLSGEFLQVNRWLVAELKAAGLWNEAVRDGLKASEGSVQGLEGLPPALKERFRTVWELPMRALIDMAAERGAFIDQSQSLNLFAESPNIGKLSSMYMHAWRQGVKTTYYLRSRPATRIAKTTAVPAAAAVACSLENPESCEACQ